MERERGRPQPPEAGPTAMEAQAARARMHSCGCRTLYTWCSFRFHKISVSSRGTAHSTARGNGRSPPTPPFHCLSASPFLPCYPPSLVFHVPFPKSLMQSVRAQTNTAQIKVAVGFLVESGLIGENMSSRLGLSGTNVEPQFLKLTCTPKFVQVLLNG